MVRLVHPREGMSIYDPCSGSGGMLIYARNHVAYNVGNPANLHNCETTQAYMARRLAEGRTKKEVTRCLQALHHPLHLSTTPCALTSPPFKHDVTPYRNVPSRFTLHSPVGRATEAPGSSRTTGSRNRGCSATRSPRPDFP